MRIKLFKVWFFNNFVKHRYWFNQGNSVFTSISAIPMEKIAIIMAVGKYFVGDNVENWIIYTIFGAYCVWRLVSRWFFGYLWHKNDVYDIESKFNIGKVPPGRVEMINIDELAEAIVKKWVR